VVRTLQPVDNPVKVWRSRAILGTVAPRFYTLPDVAETLNISMSQARALVGSGELLAIQVGGRGQWRVEATELEAYIQRMYAQTRAKVEARAAGLADPDD